MGNCCPASSGEEQQVLTAGGQRVKAFDGEGHRLGTAGETTQLQSPTPNSIDRDESVPARAVDPTLTDDERAKIRADRAAAAEARLKQQGGAPKKKKTTNSDAPLRGPNSQPTLRWTAG